MIPDGAEALQDAQRCNQMRLAVIEAVRRSIVLRKQSIGRTNVRFAMYVASGQGARIEGKQPSFPT